MRKKNLLPLTSDIVFKAAFGRDTPESKQALIAMLNIILEREKDPIVDLQYKNPFHYAEYSGDKTIIMDIKVVTQCGEWIGVEMQVKLSDWFVGRTLFYNAKLMGEQLAAGEEYDKIKKSIVVSIVQGTLFPQTKEPLSVFRYKEVKHNFELTGLLELRYLELGKIDGSKRPQDMTPLERLAAYLKYAADADRMDYVKELLTEGEEAIAMADRILGKISEDERLRQIQISQEMAETYRRIDLGESRAAGREEGREEGRAWAIEQIAAVQREMIQRMKALGKGTEEISQLMGLSLKEIEDMESGV